MEPRTVITLSEEERRTVSRALRTEQTRLDRLVDQLGRLSMASDELRAEARLVRDTLRKVEPLGPKLEALVRGSKGSEQE